VSTLTPDRLTLPEASIYCGKHVATIRRRIHSGELPAVRIGRRHCVLSSDLDNLFTPVAVPVVPRHVSTGPFEDLEAAAKRVAAMAPPLSADQRARIASLLGGASR
jgi:excisionase family DNA binding protein